VTLVKHFSLQQKGKENGERYVEGTEKEPGVMKTEVRRESYKQIEKGGRKATTINAKTLQVGEYRRSWTWLGQPTDIQEMRDSEGGPKKEEQLGKRGKKRRPLPAKPGNGQCIRGGSGMADKKPGNMGER